MGNEANYSKIFGNEGRTGRDGACFRAKTPKCVENGIRMGKARLPSKNNKAKWTRLERLELLKKRKSSGDGSFGRD